MNYTGIDFIKNKISPIKSELINHKVYESIITLDDMSTFMEHYIFTVWDFMSLLKSLQIHLTSICIPLFPKGDGEVRYLINEIVVGEENDLDSNGIRKSHFEIYLDAMDQIGASTKKFIISSMSLKKQDAWKNQLKK
jgi:hypothetical protein